MDLLTKIVGKVVAKERNNEVLVGVCGGTGVGKTSLLNALLGIDELLPSGQEEAATAVPCKVSWNYDDRPGHECRAEVHFQEKQRVLLELRFFLKAFFLRFFAERQGLVKDTQECELVIAQGMDRFAPIWKFDEEQLEERLLPPDDEDDPCEGQDIDQPDVSESQRARESATLSWILSLNQEVARLLTAGVKTMEASTPGPLSKEMKNYLDSREGSHGDEDGPKFAVWPLVEEVHVFVKSDLLRDGVCLVDLPGVGDSNSCRNSIAGKYMERLHLTIIVSTIIRGKDTKDFNDLVGARQEMTMRMDGTLDKNHFAMVFTKIDDMQSEKYQFHNDRDNALYTGLRAEGRARLEDAARFDKGFKRLEKAISKTRKKMNKEKNLQESIVSARQGIGKASKVLISLAAKRGAAEVQAEISRQRQVQLAIIARNRHVRVSVENSIARQQKAFSRRGDRRIERRKRTPGSRVPSSQEETTSQQVAEIFMTSSRGYWELQRSDKLVPVPGLPSERFTGIPEVRQWIQRAAALHREGHLDDVLADQQVVLEMINTWCRSATRSSTEPEPRATPRQIEDALKPVHKRQYQVRKYLLRGVLLVCTISPTFSLVRSCWQMSWMGAT